MFIPESRVGGVEGLGLLKLADTSLILINPSPSNVKKPNTIYGIQLACCLSEPSLGCYNHQHD